MKNRALYALSISAASTLLGGCGALRQAQDDIQPQISVPGALPQTSALAARVNRTHYKLLYSFGAPPDGNYPTANLIDVGGTLYGTTVAGGSNSCPTTSYQGCGTVFSVTLGGAEKVLYNFGGGSDGSSPQAGLINVGGTLYGTTDTGGIGCSYTYPSFGCGTVFSITPSGAEKVLYKFPGSPDGAYPLAGLVDVNGTLYGTTTGGGDQYFDACYSLNGCGTVYSITTQGEEKVLYAFGKRHHGLSPDAGLIDVKANLYGTTHDRSNHLWGSVFRITTGGAEKALHGFNEADGASPYAGLIELNGKLYGTTTIGGAYSCSAYEKGCGTVFSVPLRGGTENVLHSFNGADGYFPLATLIELKGKFYGTTRLGGASSEGTVFSITPGGTEKVLYSFGRGSDGNQPAAELIDVNGTLYGTTTGGGTYGHGTVFALTP
ncbi:MAG: choice-of-anchor tandem repeat GloVer-containing protein [Candidatus Cybelea sp.]